MHLADFMCYIVLMITVTATCVNAEQQNKEVEEPQNDRKITKRDATVLVDFNSNPMDKIFQRPKVIYRRISKTRFGPSKTKFGSYKSNHDPIRPRNRPHKPTRKPGKKGRTGKPKSSSSRYEQYKRRAQKNKPKYGAPQFRPNNRPGFGHVLKMPHYSFFAPYSAAGFAEPPTQHSLEHQQNKNSHTESPVDSYGAPLKPTIKDLYSTPFSAKETSHDFEDYKTQENSWSLKHTENSDDTTYAFTKEKPVYSNFVTPVPKDGHLMDILDPVGDKQIMQDVKFFYRKKRPYYFADSKAMNVNRPWKANKSNQFDDEIVVGGQYAEPPARYVSQNSPVDDEDDDEDLFPALQGYMDAEMAMSADNSPYSNYRHSNMAFSPQNLNDAFSMVDK